MGAHSPPSLYLSTSGKADSLEGPIPYIFKFVVAGEPAVGKSCLLLQFVEQRFNSEHELTIGAEYSSRLLKADGKLVRLKLWDTAGCEQFRSIAQNYYRGAVGAILVYDVTKRASFDPLDHWISDLKANCAPELKILLVGNKCDLDFKREVRYSEGRSFAQEYGLAFLETSAKTARNVEKLFVELSSQLLRTFVKSDVDFPSEALPSKHHNGKPFYLTHDKRDIGKIKKCC